MEFFGLIALIVAALCPLAIANRLGKWAVALLGVELLFGLGCSGIFFSPFLLIQAVLLLVVLAGGWWLSFRPGVQISGCWIATAVAFGCAMLIGQLNLWNLYDLRQKFPLESMHNRLGYERSRPSIIASTFDGEAHLELASHVEQRLVSRETVVARTFRVGDLARLHDERYEAFIATQGFGVGRMRGVHQNGLGLPEPELPALAAPSEIESAAPAADLEVVPTPQEGFPHSENLGGLADAAESNFLAPERFGWVRDGKAAGFISHRFGEEPAMSDAEAMKDQWQLTRLELVSLLKFQVPAVYETDKLPRMDELKAAPTRPLDDFERHALARLQTDDDLVIRYSTNTIRMLGSLRAGKKCLECHSIGRGALLGAFSYELRRTSPRPIAPQPPRRKPDA